jgi:hypothetical protein
MTACQVSLQAPAAACVNDAGKIVANDRSCPQWKCLPSKFHSRSGVRSDGRAPIKIGIGCEIGNLALHHFKTGQSTRAAVLRGLQEVNTVASNWDWK